MSKILVVAEHDGARLNPSTLKCVSCAAKIPGAAIDVLVLATDSSAVAAQAAAIAGVGKVLAVDNPANAEGLAAVLAPQVAKLAADYTHVFGPSTTFGKDVMPRIAALLEHDHWRRQGGHGRHMPDTMAGEHCAGAMLEQFIAVARSLPGVAFERLDAYVERWAAGGAEAGARGGAEAG